MKKLFYLKPIIAIFAITAFVFIGCEKDSPDEMITDELELFDEVSFNQEVILKDIESSSSRLKNSETEICGEKKVYPLIASKYYWAGALVVWNDSENLYVTYWSWLPLSEFHLFVGDIENLPVNKNGNPKIGHFPYSVENVSKHMHTFEIPLAELPECPDIAAHAVFGNHTIWAKDCSDINEFDGKRWGWWLENQCIDECEPGKVLAIKCKYEDPEVGGSFEAVLTTGESSYTGTWCSQMSAVVPEDGGEYNMLKTYTNDKIAGIAKTSFTEDELIVEISAIYKNYLLKSSYVFYGTQEELDALTNSGGCPSFSGFQYTIIDTYDSKHTFSIPLE